MTFSLLDLIFILIFILLLFGAFFIGVVTAVMRVIKSERERREITYKGDKRGERK